MREKYAVKIEIFDSLKYTIDLYTETEFDNKLEFLHISEEGKNIYYEYFDTKEEAKAYILSLF